MYILHTIEQQRADVAGVLDRYVYDAELALRLPGEDAGADGRMPAAGLRDDELKCAVAHRVADPGRRRWWRRFFRGRRRLRIARRAEPERVTQPRTGDHRDGGAPG